MTWKKLCTIGDIANNSAAVVDVDGVDVLVVRRQGRYLAVPPLCPYMAQALSEGCFDECFDGDAPRCNKHLQQSLAKGGNCPGVAEAPILMYESREIAGAIYVDLQKQRLSEYQHISCSPVVERGGTRALKFNLWSGQQGELKESVYGDGKRSPAPRKR